MCRRNGLKQFRREFIENARERRVEREQVEQLQEYLGKFNWRNGRHPIRCLEYNVVTDG